MLRCILAESIDVSSDTEHGYIKYQMYILQQTVYSMHLSLWEMKEDFSEE